MSRAAVEGSIAIVKDDKESTWEQLANRLPDEVLRWETVASYEK